MFNWFFFRQSKLKAMELSDLRLQGQELRGQIDTLKEWLEETKKERDYYKNLLLEKTGVIVPPQVIVESSGVPQPVGKKNWNTVKHDLEMQSLRKYWDSRKVNKGEIPDDSGK